MPDTKTPRYPVGTQFMRKQCLCTIVDYHVTYNLAGEIVRTRYVATHEFMGQILADSDLNETAIAMGLARLKGEI